MKETDHQQEPAEAQMAAQSSPHAPPYADTRVDMVAPSEPDDPWVVRPKAAKSDRWSRRAAGTLKAADLARGDFVQKGARLSSASAHDDRSRRWLAVGLFALVYVVGSAGVWSMYQSFNQDMPSAPLTPAGETQPDPSPGEPTEVRDA